MEGVSYVSLPVLREAQLGMTHEENPDRKISLMELVQDESTDAVGFMQKIYEALVHDAHALSQYREFFQILLRQKEGGGAVALFRREGPGGYSGGAGAGGSGRGAGSDLPGLYADEPVRAERLAQMLGRAAGQGADERALTGIAVMNCAKREFPGGPCSGLSRRITGIPGASSRAKMGLGPAELENLRENYLAPFPQKRIVLQ